MKGVTVDFFSFWNSRITNSFENWIL